MRQRVPLLGEELARVQHEGVKLKTHSFSLRDQFSRDKESSIILHTYL